VTGAPGRSGRSAGGVYRLPTLNDVSGTPSLYVDGSMPWWWIVCTLTDGSTVVCTT
jgi:hypothetical protein